MNYRHVIYDFYNFFLDNFSLDNPSCVGWSDRNSQYIRFKKLLEIGVKPNSTLLDYGCGVGDLVKYLEARDFDKKNYTGIDISYNCLKNARDLNPNVNFLLCEIDDVLDKYDYVVASGVFTIGMPFDVILSSIDKCYELCNYGLAFNMIHNNFIDEKLEYMNTFDPNEIYNLLKEKYDNVELINDYLINEDFTIYIYKNEKR